MRILIFILFLCSSFSINKEVNIIIETVNPDHKQVGADIKIFSLPKKDLLAEHHTYGLFSIALPEGTYLLQIQHCDTVSIELKAFANHKKIVFLNDDCVTN